MPSFQVDNTPNPNSLKFTTDGGPFIQSGLVSIQSEDEAADHPLGQRLFAIEGVTDLLILPAFLTVSKAPDASWNDILPTVQATLEDHFEARDA